MGLDRKQYRRERLPSYRRVLSYQKNPCQTTMAGIFLSLVIDQIQINQ
jgi:hypothetical protein